MNRFSLQIWTNKKVFNKKIDNKTKSYYGSVSTSTVIDIVYVSNMDLIRQVLERCFYCIFLFKINNAINDYKRVNVTNNENKKYNNLR